MMKGMIKMSAVKEQAKKIIDNLPEQATWEDLMYQFYVKKKIENSLKAIDDGEVVLHSKSRDEIFRNMNKYKDSPSMISIRYAGKIPEGVNVLL